MDKHSKKCVTYKITDFDTIVVTGGSSGIGKAFINVIHTLNPHVRIFNLSRTIPALNLPELLMEHISCDLIQEKETAMAGRRLVETLSAKASVGPILLINNSGFGSYGPFPEPDTERMLAMLKLNTAAPVHLTGVLLPLMQKRGGVIMNIASTAAFQPTPYLGTYGASKAFLLHWSLALDKDLIGTGVRSLAVCPGPTATNFFRSAGFESSPLPSSAGLTAEQVARESLRALERGKSLVVTGISNKLMTFFASKLPKTWVNWCAEKILKRIRLQR